MTSTMVDDIPELFAIWDEALNTVPASMVASGSNKKYWWKCDAGISNHQYDSNPALRIRAKYKCPICNGRRIVPGINDFATRYPKIAAEWHPTKNFPLQPNEISHGSKTKVWWVGSCDHEWVATINNRVANSQGCAVCSNRQATENYSLLSEYPLIAKEWDFTKNKTSDLSKISVSYGKKVWWVCPLQHSYDMAVSHRTLRGFGCLVCSGKRVVPGFNDLATINPAIASQWDTAKNNGLLASEFTAGSSKRFWWLCDKQHSWEASIKTRSNGFKCTVCSNHTVMLGVNSIADTHPELLEAWDYEKNTVTPQELSYGSGIQVWWLCEKNHSFLAKPNTLTTATKKTVGCRRCSSSGTSKKEKDLASYISSLLPGVEIITSTKKIISPLELDIYVPSLNVAFEFNGLYWHSEAQGKGSDYHRGKWLACKEQGIQLIQVWEDDWDLREDVVKRMIAHKLGVSSIETVYARKTSFNVISSEEATKFLVDNHLQGSRIARHFGLRDSNGVLVSLLSMIVKDDSVGEVARFVSSVNVPGGFTKLLSGWLALNPNIVRVITYSHNDYSDGGVYKNNGFVQVHDGSPGYAYIYGGERVNRLKFMKKRFKDDPLLEYVEGYTERKLASLNGLVRVWDSGSSLWEFVV